MALEALRTRRISVAAAAFSAPMWGLSTRFYQRWYARSARLFGFGGAIARPPGPAENFADNQLTHDEKRWAIQRDLIAKEPRLAIGEPTVAWVVASLNVMKALFAPKALDHLDKLPVVVAIASEETIVQPSAQRRLGRRLKAAKLVVIEGSRHEILMETDELRARFWRAFDEMCKRSGV
ncbi:MAG: alpha/beta hydrolase [Alphaproteobacteria bacterium]|nr:alpha/beta hydrolase [Alphaproteobacteria bacterium]